MSLYDLTALSYHVRKWVIHVPFLTYDVTDRDDYATDHDIDDTDNVHGDNRHKLEPRTVSIRRLSIFGTRLIRTYR